jgi:RNA polymerase sigma factor (sigma-70 family)
MTEKQKKSIDAFFRAEYNKLINYVRRNMDERFYEASPEDIIQDVALSLLAKLDVNAQIENLAAYIYRSLKNRIIDTKRKTRNNVQIESLANKQHEYPILHDLTEEIESAESNTINFTPAQLHDAIDQLKPDEQAIIISTEFEEMTFDELSRKWNIPIGTLLSRKHRALAKLNKLLTKKIEQTN